MEQIILDLFTLEGFIKLLEYLVIAAEFVYLLFAFIITREVTLMNRSFKTSAAGLFSLLALLHLAGTAVLLFISFSFLIS